MTSLRAALAVLFIPCRPLGFLLFAIVAVLSLPVHVGAQSAARVPRLCFLTFDPGTLQSTQFNAFFEALNELGYVNGRTITIDYLSAEGRAERVPAIAAECVRLKVDIIAVSTTPAAQAAKTMTHTIPIVTLAVGDPVGTGLADSLARPGGNVTGLSSMLPGLAAKRLELLKETVPRISRVLVLSYLADPIAPPQIKALRKHSGKACARPAGSKAGTSGWSIDGRTAEWTASRFWPRSWFA